MVAASQRARYLSTTDKPGKYNYVNTDIQKLCTPQESLLPGGELPQGSFIRGGSGPQGQPLTQLPLYRVHTKKMQPFFKDI